MMTNMLKNNIKPPPSVNNTPSQKLNSAINPQSEYNSAPAFMNSPTHFSGSNHMQNPSQKLNPTPSQNYMKNRYNNTPQIIVESPSTNTELKDSPTPPQSILKNSKAIKIKSVTNKPLTGRGYLVDSMLLYEKPDLQGKIIIKKGKPIQRGNGVCSSWGEGISSRNITSEREKYEKPEIFTMYTGKTQKDERSNFQRKSLIEVRFCKDYEFLENGRFENSSKAWICKHSSNYFRRNRSRISTQKKS